ncbi:MAG: hypothetical protein D6715_00835 [Calditrichaeota bacterium]|nr:MAG: hypothetical protein D6715_00835 [Calditrichota bacterium]
MALDELLKGIIDEARREAEKMLEQTARETEQTLARWRQESEQEALRLQKEGIGQCQREVNQRLSHHRLALRKRWLEAQQELLEAVLAQAAEHLEKLPAETYRHWIVETFLAAWDGQTVSLILPEQHRSRLGDAFEEQIRQAAGRQKDVSKLTIKWEPLEGGGFLLRGERSDQVFTFAQRLQEVRRNQLHELARILFAGSSGEVEELP